MTFGCVGRLVCSIKAKHSDYHRLYRGHGGSWHVSSPSVQWLSPERFSHRDLYRCLFAKNPPTLYSRVCFSMSSSSRVKFSSTDTALISWYACQSKTSSAPSVWVWSTAGLWHAVNTNQTLAESHVTSASLDDMNLRTTCLRYSKLISLESLRSEVLVTVVLEVGGLGVDAGAGSGQTLSGFSALLSGSFSRPSASDSGFNFYRARREKSTQRIKSFCIYTR